MHGATTSTVSSASTPVTNVPFAESAASNQVCSFSSLVLAQEVLFIVIRPKKKKSTCLQCHVYYVHISSVYTFQSVVMLANENVSCSLV